MTTHSLVVIAPIAAWPGLQQLNGALGFDAGPGVPLSETGALPVTYLGLHAWVGDEYASWALGEAVPPGIPAEMIAAALAVAIVSVDAEGLTGYAHFHHVCDALGLQGASA